VKGAHSIGVYDTESFVPEPPLTNEHIPSDHRYFSVTGKLIRKTDNISQTLAQEVLKPKKTFEELVPESFQMYKDIFGDVANGTLLPSRKFKHMIDLKETFKLRKCKIYPLNTKEEKVMNDFIDKHLAKGTIVPSESPQSSPFFFVSKKDGSL
jgi:hypothetical protein